MGALRCRFVSYPSDGFLSPSLAVHVSLATGKTSVTGKCTRRNMELLVPWDINIVIAFRYQEEMQLLRFLREGGLCVCVPVLLDDGSAASCRQSRAESHTLLSCTSCAFFTATSCHIQTQ